MNTSPNQCLKSMHMGVMMAMRERAFWQSRSNLRDPPQLVDLSQLARTIRRTWP